MNGKHDTITPMHIGFDLDKIFINHPPLVPSWIINKLYGEKVNGHLSYRIPGKLEQKLRKVSHMSFLRPAIQKNIALLQNIKKQKQLSFYLISSRFGFLKDETETLVEKYDLKNLFTKMDFNFANMQPHNFKNEMIRKRGIQRFVDDDLPLLLFLAPKNPEVQFFWLNKKETGKIFKNIEAITSLSKVFN